MSGVVRLVLAYAVFGGLWVVFSDWLVLWWVKDPARLTELGQIKGLAFVLLSSVLLLGLASREQRLRERHQQLEQQQAQEFRYLFQNNPLPMWVFDQETLGFLEVNQAATEKYGYSREEFLTMTLRDIRSERDWARLEATLRDPRALLFTQDWQHRLKDGRVIEVEASIHSLEFAHRAARLAVIYDVTGRKQMERQLRQAEEHFRLMTEQSAVPMLVYQDTHIVYANPAMQQLTGYSAQELSGLRPAQILHPSSHPILAELTEQSRAYQQGNPLTARTEAQILTRQGQIRQIEVAWSPLHFQGRPATIVTAYDLTELRQAEEALRRSEEIYRTLARNLPQGSVFLFDHQLRFLVAEGQGLQESGLSSQTFEGQTLYQARPPESVAYLEPLYRAALAGETREDERSFAGRHYKVHALPVRNAEGEIWAGMAVGYDITHLRQAQEELQRLNQLLEARVAERTRRLQEVNSELEAFSYTVSHDLRAPLRTMQGFAQALLEDYAQELGASGRDYAQRIVGAAERLDRLIGDLLAYSRLARSELEIRTVELAALLQRVVEGVWPQDGRGEIRLEGGFPRVQANPTVLEQVFTNLLANALKFVSSGRDAQVRVWSEPAGEYQRVWVEDNGIGIAPEHQGRIFQPFERLHGVSEYSGTGIGLAIVKRGLERMQGRVGVESGVGQGSRFWVELRRA